MLIFAIIGWFKNEEEQIKLDKARLDLGFILPEVLVDIGKGLQEQKNMQRKSYRRRVRKLVKAARAEYAELEAKGLVSKNGGFVQRSCGD